jgi:O-antigen/teichoic acid export membrane protein
MTIPYLAWAQEELERRFPPGSLGERFARGAAWSLIGIVISQGLGLAASVVTARLLGKVGFGELGMIRSTVGMFGIFAGLGTGLTATKYVAEYRATQPDRAGRVIGLTLLVTLLTGGLAAGAVVAIAPFLAANTINAPQLAPELRIGALLLFLNAISGAQTGVLGGFEAFQRIATVNLIAGLASFPFVVGGALLGRLPGALWGFVLVSAVGIVLHHLAIRAECRLNHVSISYRPSLAERRLIFKFSAPAFLSGALSGPAAWLVNALLVRQPDGYAEMGVLAAATQWQSVFLFVPSLLGRVTIPMLSSLQAGGNRTASRKVLGTSIITSAAVAAPVLLALLAFSDRFIGFYGEGFAGRGTVLQITAVTAALAAINSPVGNLIAAHGRMWVGAAMNGGWVVVLLATSWIFLSLNWGAEGAAGAYVAAYVCHTTWVGLFAAKLFRRPPQ